MNHPSRALAGLSLAMLMPSLDTSIANAALPALAQQFGAPFQQVQWIVLAYLLAVTTLIVAVGRLGDLLGRRRLLLAGIVLFVLASLLCALAPGLWCLLAARTLQGLAAAVMLALSMASVGDAVSKENTGSAMGLLGSMSAIGTTLGPALGGLLLASCGWRAIFLVNLPLGLLAFWLVLRHLPSPLPILLPAVPASSGALSASQQATAETARMENMAKMAEPAQPAASTPSKQAALHWFLRFDVAGVLLLALSLSAYALAMTMGRGHVGSLNLVLLLAAVLAAALFLRNEYRAPSPLIALALFRDRAMRSGLATNALVATVIMTTLVVGPFYLAQGLGLAVAQVGLVLSLGPLVSALSGIPAGRLAQRFGAVRMSVAGLIGMLLAALALACLPSRLGLAGYLPPIVLMTASYAQFQAANNTALLRDIAPGQRGLLAALIGLTRNLGLITGAAVMGAIYALASAVPDCAAGSPPACTSACVAICGPSSPASLAAASANGLHLTFAVAAGLLGLALVLMTGKRILQMIMPTSAQKSGQNPVGKSVLPPQAVSTQQTAHPGVPDQASKSAAAMVPVVSSGRNT